MIDLTSIFNTNNTTLFLRVFEVSGVLGATYFAAKSVKLAHQSLVQQRKNEEPKIVVFVRQVKDSLNIIDFVVKNEGARSARNIKLKVTGTNINALSDRKIKDIALIKNGVALLAGGEEIKQPLGVMIGDSYKEYKKANTKIKVSYEGDNGQQNTDVFTLDFKGLIDRKLGSSHTESIAKSLSSIQKELHAIKKDIHLVANKGITQVFPESITYHDKREITEELK